MIYKTQPQRLLLLPLLIACFCLSTEALAQNIQYNNKAVDLGLRSTQRVNPSTRGVEFEIPLGHYRGRGGFDVPITLSYSSKVWGIEFQGFNSGAPPPHQPQAYTIVVARYGDHSVAGWTTTVGFPQVDPSPGNQIYDQFGNPTFNCTGGCYAVDRLMVWMPDGSGHELRATDQPRPTTQAAADDYYAVDGSRMRYQKSTQILFLSDGSRYLIGAGKYIDKNGNTLTANGGWRDTLDRQINNPLPVAPGSSLSAPTDQNYSLLGVNGTSINYTLKWRNLADVLTTAQPLRYTADGGCPPGTGSFSPYLFTSDGGSRTCIINAGSIFNPVVLSQIVLPNGQTYTFTYDIFGAIDKVVLPNGGYEKYEYSYVAPVSSAANFSFVYAQGNRGVTRHVISTSGLSEDEVQWLYSGGGNTVTMTAPDGTRTDSYMWTDGVSGWGYSADSSRAGRTYDERIFSASGQMIRRKLTDWATTPSNATGGPSGTQAANRNARIVREVEILLDAPVAVARTRTYGYDTTYQYDVGLEQTSVNEFDYVDIDQNTAQTLPITSLSTIPNGTLLRSTESDYLTGNINYRSRNLLGLVTATRTKDGAGNIVAQSSNLYDEAAFPLLTYPSVLGWTDPATAFRGNVTTVSNWLNFNGANISTFPQGTYLTTHTQYDQCGSVRKTWDANDTSLSNPTQLDYSDTYQRAYATTQTSPDPDGAGPRLPLTNSIEYDFSTGLVTAAIDPNSQRTTYAYNDSMNRLTQSIRAATDTSAKTQTTYAYDDVARTLTTTSDLNNYNDNLVKTVAFFDGMGRLQELRNYEDSTKYISVQHQYDAFGRIFKVSNPFRPLDGESARWTTQLYDGLGRITSVTTPDNAVVTSSYSGNATTMTDQMGTQRKTVMDALERLKQVVEAPNDSNFNYLTTYEYDALDSRISVAQDAQHRYFFYDSLKRMIRSRNPEQGTYPSLTSSGSPTGNTSWSFGYQYDNNNNLTQQTDARGVVSTYGYDALNRNTAISYTNDPSGTLPVTFSYDSATNGKGQLYQAQTTGASGSLFTIDSYDALGRPLTERQQFFANGTWSLSYTMQRSYDRAGNVITQTYPSGHTVTYGYDNVGRASSFIGTLGDGNSRTYSNEIIYSPFGGLAKEKFGTATTVYNKLFYNNRRQLAEIRAGTSYTGPTDTTADRGAIVNHYSNQCSGMCLPTSSMTDNNGNLKKQEVFIPNQPVRWQQYDYDSLNRLNWAREVLNGIEQWKQQFTYDRWGNRTVNIGVTYGIPEKDFTVTTSNNRLGVPSGQSGTMDYDGAGNLINDTYSGAGNRTYDAKNRIVSAWGGNNQAQLYTYDASSQRIRRKVDGVETWQIYGFGDQLLAEYQANGAANSPTKEYGYRNGQLLISADSGNASVSPIFGDDFNDNSINPNSWTVWYPGSTPTVTEQSQQLQIALSPNTAAYNGVYSNSTYNLTNNMVQVESVQAVSQAGWCENFLELELDANNYFMIQVGAGNMIFRSRVNGANDQTSSSFDGAANRFWRIRHDQSANLIYFETSADGTVWLTRKTVTPGFSLTSLRFHLLAGAYGTGNSSPGTAKYDNFKLLPSSSGPVSLTVPNAGFEAPVIGNGNFQYGPSGGSWTFAGGGGISGMNSPFTGVPSAAPEGVQVAFIQAGGTISQSISGFQANANYVITFKAIQRTNCCNTTGQDIDVYIDNTLVGTFHPSNSAYVEYSTPAFTTATGAHTVKFAGLNVNGDQTAFLDNVRITGSPRPGYGVQWLVADQLGTPRMTIDESGSLANVKRHDYLPFGEELLAPISGRTAAQGYLSGDGVRQQFTSKDRDVETGLDYFAARYYSSVQGRFTSVDPDNTGAIPSDPQSWNAYAYARNNPLKYSDPDGKAFKICNNDAVCVIISDEEAKQYTFNKNYQRNNGYYTQGDGKIYSSDGSVIGTYENLGCDCWSDSQNRMVTGIADELDKPSTYLFGAAAAVGRMRMRPIKPINLPSARNVLVDMEEVASGHMVGGSRAVQSAAAGAGKSLFPEYMTKPQVESAIIDAYTHSNVTYVQGVRVMLEGITKDGTKIEMWFNRETKIIETAYPTGRTSWASPQ